MDLFLSHLKEQRIRISLDRVWPSSMPLVQIEGVESVFDRQLKRPRYGKEVGLNFLPRCKCDPGSVDRMNGSWGLNFDSMFLS